MLVQLKAAYSGLPIGSIGELIELKTPVGTFSRHADKSGLKVWVRWESTIQCPRNHIKPVFESDLVAFRRVRKPRESCHADPLAMLELLESMD